MLLKLSNVDALEDQLYLSNNLRFFKWHGCPLKTLPSNFEARNLFELNLYGSRIKYLWTGKKAFPKLKTINLSNSNNLIETLDFTKVPNLEMLDLKGCTRLRKVHKSVGVLKSLIVLNLEGCNSLQSFPNNLFGLKSLKILNLQGCSKLDKLLENLEELEHLEELDVGGTAITQVPSSIARLTNLQKLSFQKLNAIFWKEHSHLDSLCSLEKLDLSKNKFISLPESIKRLSKLGILSLENCERLRSLPELPSNILFVGAEGCHSLEDISLRGCTSSAIEMRLFNCHKLIQNRGHPKINLAVMLLKQRLQKFEHERSLTLESAQLGHWDYDEYDSTNSVLVSTSTCIHARFNIIDRLFGCKSRAFKSGIRLVYKRDIECSEDDLPATDASILHQHHNCSTFHGDRSVLLFPFP
ncbi:hypothetical protein EZV62_019466 [Acer yangbiense]|uniref:Disease resistance R13L4/SHOC-2-like LRR domain-containing protein n=1 Tax=Acer yangbiense TaxID=1000413 RepID=A0A5C7HB00_9ROSI|nr:hypothetical protein EZV62_019466 [Acer yangbiense]